MHSREVSELKVILENVNCLIEEQQIRENECDRQMVENAQQMDKIKKVIKEMSRKQRGP